MSADADAKIENAEAEAEEVEGTFTEIVVNDAVETTRETGEGHLGFCSLCYMSKMSSTTWARER